MAVPGQSFVRVRDVTDPQRQARLGPFHDLLQAANSVLGCAAIGERLSHRMLRAARR